MLFFYCEVMFVQISFDEFKYSNKIKLHNGSILGNNFTFSIF